MDLTTLEQVKIGGIYTSAVTREQLVDNISAACSWNRQHERRALPLLVFSTNGQTISLYATDASFRAVFDMADVVHADGMPIVMWSRILGSARALPDRIATTDFFHDVAERAEFEKLRFFIMGGTENANKKVCQNIVERYPGVIISGRKNGFFDETESSAICQEIRDSGTDVLWVGLGKPKQEAWATRHREALRGVSVIKTCGGLYQFLNGDVSRAPSWMQSLGLEWAHRLWKEPSRLGLRYATTNIHAIWKMATDSGETRTSQIGQVDATPVTIVREPS